MRKGNVAVITLLNISVDLHDFEKTVGEVLVERGVENQVKVEGGLGRAEKRSS